MALFFYIENVRKLEINLRLNIQTNEYLRNVISVEIDDAIDEVILGEHTANALPIAVVFTQQQTNGLEGHFYQRWWVSHGL